MTAYNAAEVERLIAEARNALSDLDAPDYSWFVAHGSDVIDQLEAARAEIDRLRARPAPTLAERCHKVQRLTSNMESDLWRAVEAACGKGNVTPSDDGELRTDEYDNSIEVWGVGNIDLDAAARKLKESGFGKVWLHQHMDRENCKCPLR